jgi:hypothetical protein
VDCKCKDDSQIASPLKDRLIVLEKELLEVAQRLLKTASDPVTPVVRFLHERPENVSLPGYVLKRVLHQAFGQSDNVPGMVNLLAGHVKEIVRHANVINIINEHASMEYWGNYMIKQKERIKFEVTYDKGRTVLKNIQGLVAVQHGIDASLDKVLINPPQMEITLKVGILRPRLTVDIG